MSARKHYKKVPVGIRRRMKRANINIAAEPRYRKINIPIRVPEPWRRKGINTMPSLEQRLLEPLSGKMGERGHQEDPVDCLYRIIRERDEALLILAFDRLKQNRHW